MSRTDPRETLAKEIAVAAAVTGSELSAPALAVMVEDLLGYPLDRAVNAIRRARRECTRLTLAGIIERVDGSDGHPGPDEAWAMCPMTEADSVVWTEQMARAYAIADVLVKAGDRIGGRMAFKDAYVREVEQARLARAPVHWTASLGTDQAKRETAITQALQSNRLTLERAQALLPAPTIEAAGALLQLPAQDDEALRRRWANLRAQLQASKAEAV